MKFKEPIFLYVKKIIEEEKKGSFLLKSGLLFFSFFVRFFVFLKNFAYDKKIFLPHKIDTFVISIGNIVAGGTGKTPFAIYLSEKLIKRGKKVAIVSKGYGKKDKSQKDFIYINCLKENKIFSPDLIGDEPYMIARRVPSAHIVVGSNKIYAVKEALLLKPDVLILDDGFQSRKIERDLDIVLLNSQKPFSNGYFLPRGLLRDSKKSLKRADLLVLTNGEEVKSFLNEEMGKKCIYSSSFFFAIKDLKGGLVDLKEKKVSLFCAIANPLNFSSLVQKEGFEIIDQKFFFDHSYFSTNFLTNYSKEAKEKGAKALLCTEKDMVKVPKDLALVLPIYYLEIKHKIIFGEEKLEELLQIKQ